MDEYSLGMLCEAVADYEAAYLAQDRSNRDLLPALPGVVELAEQVFEMPVRLGVPGGIGGLAANVADPRFATGLG